MHALFIRWLGPVFARDLIEISRQRRTYFLRILYGSFLLYAAYLAWERVGGQTDLNLSQMAVMCARLFDSVVLLQILSIHLIAPMLLCNAIAGERKAGTLDLLFTTHLTDREIVIGKLAGRLISVFVLLLSSIPVLALFSLFGGLAFHEVAALEAYSVGALLFAGGVAIGLSARYESPFVALAMTLALQSIPLIAFAVLSSGHRALLGIPAAVIGILFVRFGIEHLHFTPRKREGRLWKPLLRRLRKARSEGMLNAERSLWGPLEIRAVDEEPPLRENLWVFAVLGSSFLINVVMLREYQTGGLLYLLLPLWCVVFMLSAMIAISNPILVRRPGFFDLLLGTLLEPRDILGGAVSVNKPWLLRIYLVPCLFAGLWSVASPVGLLFLSLIGIGFGGLIVTVGNVCALADPRALHRILPTFLVPLVILIGPYVAPVTMRSLPAEMLLLGAAVFLGIAFLASRGELTPGKVATRLTAFYFLVTTILVVVPTLYLGQWSARDASIAWDPIHRNPWVLYSPWFWLRALATEQTFDHAFEWLMVASYAAALAVCILDTWSWTLRNFDRLVGRGVMPSPQLSKLLSQQKSETDPLNSNPGNC